MGTPWKETLSPEGQEIVWDSIGVAFSIPPGAVVSEEEPLQLAVRPCLTGLFKPPEQYQLTSPSYHVSLSSELTEDIEMVLYHFVSLKTEDDCKRMTFLSAPGAPTSDGYRFKVIEGGVFHMNENFGTIRLRHFCKITTGTMGPKLPGK